MSYIRFLNPLLNTHLSKVPVFLKNIFTINITYDFCSHSTIVYLFISMYQYECLCSIFNHYILSLIINDLSHQLRHLKCFKYLSH